MPGYEAASWIGLLAPAATAQPIIGKLWDALSASMHEPAVKDILLRDGSDMVVSTPEEFRRVIDADDAKYARLSGLFATAK